MSLVVGRAFLSIRKVMRIRAYIPIWLIKEVLGNDNDILRASLTNVHYIKVHIEINITVH
jgi:hypothetical protein